MRFKVDFKIAGNPKDMTFTIDDVPAATIQHAESVAFSRLIVLMPDVHREDWIVVQVECLSQRVG